MVELDRVYLCKRWVIEVNGAPGTLYANETYQLQVDFPEHYPMEAPQVDFILFIYFLNYLLCLIWLCLVGEKIVGTLDNFECVI